jgi:hypothetical protein
MRRPFHMLDVRKLLLIDRGKANSAALRCLRQTAIEKANAFDIHEIHFLQIQSYSWSGALDLSLQLIKVLSSNLNAEANPRSAFTGNPFNS